MNTDNPKNAAKTGLSHDGKMMWAMFIVPMASAIMSTVIIETGLNLDTARLLGMGIYVSTHICFYIVMLFGFRKRSESESKIYNGLVVCLVDCIAHRPPKNEINKVEARYKKFRVNNLKFMTVLLFFLLVLAPAGRMFLMSSISGADPDANKYTKFTPQYKAKFWYMSLDALSIITVSSFAMAGRVRRISKQEFKLLYEQQQSQAENAPEE